MQVKAHRNMFQSYKKTAQWINIEHNMRLESLGPILINEFPISIHTSPFIFINPIYKPKIVLPRLMYEGI